MVVDPWLKYLIQWTNPDLYYSCIWFPVLYKIDHPRNHNHTNAKLSGISDHVRPFTRPSYLQVRSKKEGSGISFNGPWIPDLISTRQEKSLATKSKLLVWYFNFWSYSSAFKISRFFVQFLTDHMIWNLESRNWS